MQALGIVFMVYVVSLFVVTFNVTVMQRMDGFKDKKSFNLFVLPLTAIMSTAVLLGRLVAALVGIGEKKSR